MNIKAISNRYKSKSFERSIFRKRIISILFKIALYIFLLDIAYTFLYPFIFSIFNSFKSPADLMDPSVNWIPSEIYLKNYSLAIEAMNFFSQIANSVVITLFCTLGHVISASFIGYGFARSHSPFKKIFLLMLLITIIIPIQIIIIPLFVQFGNFGWLDTFLPIIVPTFFGFGINGGIFIFIFRQYYFTLPQELENAAYIDGCGVFKTYIRIILPLSKATILVAAIISTVWHWNDYYQPTVFLGNNNLWPVTSILPQLYETSKTAFTNFEMLVSGNIITQSVVLAGIILAEMPILVIFLICQRQFMSGIERTGLVE